MIKGIGFYTPLFSAISSILIQTFKFLFEYYKMIYKIGFLMNDLIYKMSYF